MIYLLFTQLLYLEFNLGVTMLSRNELSNFIKWCFLRFCAKMIFGASPELNVGTKGKVQWLSVCVLTSDQPNAQIMLE